MFEVSLVYEDTIYGKFVRVVSSDRLGVDSIGVKIEGCYSRYVGRFRRVIFVKYW